MNQLDIERILDEQLLKAEEAMEKKMRATFKLIQQQLTEMYLKYERDGVLTTAEMQKYNRLEKEMQRLAETLSVVYQEAVTDIQEMQENHYLLKFLLTAYLFDRFVSVPRVPTTELIAASLIFIITSLKIPRLPKTGESDTVKRIERELRKSVNNGESKSQIKKRLKSALPAKLPELDKVVEQLTDALVDRLEPTVNSSNFKVPNRSEVKKAVKFDGLTLSHYLTVQRNRAVVKMRGEILEALRKNETVHQMSKRVRKYYDTRINTMRSFMRNTSDRVRAVALGSVENQIAAISDVRGIWLSKRDLVVRTSHKILDGQRTDRKGYFHYQGMKSLAPRMWGVPGMDERCRCKKLTLLDFKIPIVAEGVKYDNQEYQRQLQALADQKMREKEITFEIAFAEALKEIPEPWGDMPFVPYAEWLRQMGVKGDLSSVDMSNYVEESYARVGKKPPKIKRE